MTGVAVGIAVAALLALAWALLAWRRGQRAAAESEAKALQRERELAAKDEVEQTAKRLSDELSEREAELQRHRAAAKTEQERLQHELSDERGRRTRLEHGRNLERAWVRELRSKVAELQAARGTLGDTSDVRAVVLKAAIQLVGAEKGLLLSREDEDSDGKLDFVCAEGFTHDPSDSAVAQRFATEVLERDRTIRENDEPDIARESRTPADDEIENLVAIPIYIRDRFHGVVVCANKPGGFAEHDDDVLLALGDQAGAVLQNNRLHGRLRSAYVATVRMLAQAIEAKDPSLRGQADLLYPYVAALAGRLDLEPKRREELLFAWLLHDIGKIGISERILYKPGPLTPEEDSILALHTRIGYRLVEQVPELASLAAFILHHHEHFDGTGYPSGLRGDAIPLESRAIAVADAFGELTAHRPGSLGPEEACVELRRQAGTQLDPELVRLFVEEVHRRPPDETLRHSLTTALADPELEHRRAGAEPVLGATAFALTDSLTLLYSHGYLHELARREAQRATLQASPFAVLLVELTEIDAINRRDGYAAGDEAIQRAARALERTAARHGGTAHRDGGARLAILLPRAGEPEAQRVSSELAAELHHDPIRCGVAAWQAGESGQDVIDRARAELAGERPLLDRVLAPHHAPRGAEPG